MSEGVKLLITTDSVGGVWRYAVTLAASLAARGLPSVLAVLGPDATAAQVRDAPVRVIQTGLPLDWTAADPAALHGASAGLAALASSLGVAGVHLHAPALIGTVRWPVPVVAVTHSCVATWWDAVRGGVRDPDLAWRIAATRAGLYAATAVIAPTAAHAADTRRIYGPVPITTVHNGAVPVTTAAVRAPAILTAGRLWDEGKGVAWLDRAAPSMAVPVRAAGPVQGPMQGPVGGRVRFANLDLLGTLDPAAMAQAMAEATVFASLSAYEPFGLAVLEAAQAGCALVLRDIPSARELWDGAAVFVAEEGALVPALHLALRDSATWGAQAQARARRYTVSAMVDGTMAAHRMMA